MARKTPHAADKQPEDLTERLLAALLDLIAERGWAAVSLADLAGRAGVSLAILHEHLGSHPKATLLAALADHLDAAVVAEGPPSGEDSVRDRLFDVAMRRFDAMQEHRAALRSLLHASRYDPWLLLCGGVRLVRSAGLMLEVAGVNAWGPVGLLKAKALAAVLAYAIRVWQSDETPDMPRTMAVLDKGLRRLEGLSGLLPHHRTAAPPPDDAESDSANA